MVSLDIGTQGINDCVVRTMGVRKRDQHGQIGDLDRSILLLSRRWTEGARG